MARTIVAVFDSFYSAGKAIQELHSLGFPQEQVDIFSRPKNGKTQEPEPAAQIRSVEPEVQTDGLRSGVHVGIGIGGALGVVGGLLGSLGLLPLPVIASAGNGLQAGLSGLLLAGITSGAGALVGGLIGSWLGLGIPEEETRLYAKNVRNGEVVINVMADWDTVDPVIEILSKHNPLEVKQKTISLPQSRKVEIKRPAHTREQHDRR